MGSGWVGVVAGAVAVGCGGLLDSDDAPQSGGTAAATGGASGGGGASAGDASAGGAFGGGGSGALSAGDCEVAGYEDCNGLPGDGCEVDTTSDSQHCGECGHACAPDQACTATGCTVGFEVVVGGQPFSIGAPADELIAAGDRLYFTAFLREIRSVPKRGGEYEVLYKAGELGEFEFPPSDLGADALYVYGLLSEPSGEDLPSGTRIRRVPLEGGDLEEVGPSDGVWGSTSGFSSSLQIALRRPFWVTSEEPETVYTLQDGERQSVVAAEQVLTSSEATPGSTFAMNDEWIFWPWSIGEDEERIVRFDPTGENLNVLDVETGPIVEVEVCGELLYWIARQFEDGGTVRRSTLSGEQVTIVQTIDKPRFPEGLACDENAAYWVSDRDNEGNTVRTDGQGALWGIQHAQAEPSMIVDGLDNPDDVALDSDFIYWSVDGKQRVSDNGAILSLGRDVLE